MTPTADDIARAAIEDNHETVAGYELETHDDERTSWYATAVRGAPATVERRSDGTAPARIEVRCHGGAHDYKWLARVIWLPDGDWETSVIYDAKRTRDAPDKGRVANRARATSKAAAWMRETPAVDTDADADGVDDRDVSDEGQSTVADGGWIGDHDDADWCSDCQRYRVSCGHSKTSEK